MASIAQFLPFPLRSRQSRRLRLVLGAMLALVIASPALAQDQPARLQVLTSFTILADFARNVGGDRADIVSLVGPDGDVHVYSPTSADAQAVRRARLVIVNGLGLEGWLPRLVSASGGGATMVVASDGIVPRKVGADEVLGRVHAAGSPDPHAWQSVANAAIYVADIRDAMIAADPADAVTYRANATIYLAKLAALDHDVRQAIARLPPDRRKVISTHDAFGYFGADYGITFLAPLGVSTESEPSAHDIAAIIDQIRTQKIPAVFMENITDSRLIRQIATETGAAIGGTLYSDSLTDASGEAPTYIEMMRHNVRTIAGALAD